ncbi:MAG: hypothetical protein JXA15_02515 [Spirochaetales bacterium]|nr:hypothetical protein [Spirochaetales bacterium]
MVSGKAFGAALLSVALAAFSWSQEAGAFEIGDVPPLVRSAGDAFAYSPLKLFDGDPATCMAVRWPDLLANGKLLFRMRSTEPGGVELRGLSVGGGFFDAKLYGRNARVKKLTVVLKTMHTDGGARYGEHRQSFELVDRMRIQTFALSAPVRGVYEIEVYVDEIHPGADWQDVCVAEFTLVSPSGPVDVHPAVGEATRILWYCDETGNPVLGRFRSDHDSGVLRVIWEDGRIVRVDAFSDVPEGPIAPKRFTWTYVRSESTVRVVGGDGRVIVEYRFDAAGTLVLETRLDTPDVKGKVLRYAPAEAASVETLVDGDVRLRLDWQGFASALDRYVDGTLHSSSRREYWYYLPPADFVKP